MNNVLDKETEAAAVNMIRNGFAPEKVLQMIYGLGHFSGLMDMASVGTKSVVDAAQAQKAAA
jgi:hypothetical protein